MKKEIKTILLTGATGFIGSNLLESLLKNNYNVLIFKRIKSDTWRINSFLTSVKDYPSDYIYGDLELPFKENNIDVVIHCATYYKRNHQYNEIETLINTNIVFPTQLLDLACSHNVPYFINTGSMAEDVLQDTLYGQTKIAFKSILQQRAKQGKIKAISLKLFSPYGLKDNFNKVIPQVILALQQNIKFQLKNPNEYISYTYIDDIIDAYLLALDFIVNSKDNFSDFDITTKSFLTLETVQNFIDLLFFNKVTNTFLKQFLSPIFFEKSLLNWVPKTNLIDGLEKTISFYKEVKL